MISHLGSQFYFLTGSLQWVPWSHFELLTWTKQEKGTSTEEQELRFTINLLTSDPNRKQTATSSSPTACIYRLVQRGKHFSFLFKKPPVWEIRSRKDINISLIMQTEGIQVSGLGDNARKHLDRIIESLMLEKTFKIIKKNHQPSTTTLFTIKPCPQVTYLHDFLTLPGIVTPPLPWEVYSNILHLFLWSNFSYTKSKTPQAQLEAISSHHLLPVRRDQHPHPHNVLSGSCREW